MKNKILRILNTTVFAKKVENPVHAFYSTTSSAKKKKVYSRALRAAEHEQLLILNH